MDELTAEELEQKLEQALASVTKVTVTHGEDNTISLPYYVKYRWGLHSQELVYSNKIYPMIQWCHQQFGPRWDIDNIRGIWDYDAGTFHFKTQGDRTMFLLRWC